MKGIPPIASVMTPFPYSIDIKDTVAAAQKIMKEHSIRHLPVLEEGRPRSIITDSEINLVLAITDGEQDLEELKVESVCAIEAYMVGIDERLDLVLDQMVERHIGSAIVLKDDRLAGIFTTMDACRQLSLFIRRHFGPNDPGGDAA